MSCKIQGRSKSWGRGKEGQWCGNIGGACCRDWGGHINGFNNEGVGILRKGSAWEGEGRWPVIVECTLSDVIRV